MLKFGSTNIGSLYIGSTEIAKAYLGSTLVFEKGGVAPPATATLSMTDFASAKTCGGYIDTSTGKAKTSTTYYGTLVSIDGFQGQTISITPGADWSGNVRFAFLRTMPTSWTNNATLYYSTQAGFTSQITTTDNPYTATIPSDAVCLYVYRYSNKINTAPASIEITGTKLTSLHRDLPASIFVAGKSVSDTGSYVDATSVCCSGYLDVATYSYYKAAQFVLNNMPEDATSVRVNIAEYTSRKTFIRRQSYEAMPVTKSLRSETVYIRLMIDKMNGSGAIPISSVWFDDDDIQVIGTNI